MDYDWKKELEFLKSMLRDECDRHNAEVKRINEQAKKVIDLAGKDAEQTWDEFSETNWTKYRYLYIALIAVFLFTIIYYVS